MKKTCQTFWLWACFALTTLQPSISEAQLNFTINCLEGNRIEIVAGGTIPISASSQAAYPWAIFLENIFDVTTTAIYACDQKFKFTPLQGNPFEVYNINCTHNSNGMMFTSSPTMNLSAGGSFSGSIIISILSQYQIPDILNNGDIHWGLPNSNSQVVGKFVLGSSCKQECNPYDFPACCPPLNANFLSELFDLQPYGNIIDPFKIKFNNNSYFTNLFQSYAEHLHSLCPTIEKLVFHWRLIDAGAGANPNDVYSPMIAETHNWFIPGQNGQITGNTGFFNEELEINHWYKMHTGIYTEPGTSLLNGCPLKYQFFFRLQVLQGQFVAVINDGKKEVQRIKLSVKSPKSRSKN